MGGEEKIIKKNLPSRYFLRPKTKLLFSLRMTKDIFLKHVPFGPLNQNTCRNNKLKPKIGMASPLPFEKKRRKKKCVVSNFINIRPFL